MYPSKPKSSADYYKRNTTPMYIPEGKSLMGVSAKNNNPNMYVRYFPKDIIGIEKSLMDRDAVLGNNLYTRAAINQYNPTTNVDFELINNTPAKVVKGEQNYYEYGDPLKADIHGVRQAGQAAGIYDPFTEPFKKEFIDKYDEFYKNNPTKNPFKQLLKFYTPEQVEYFMNNISQNQTQSEDGVQMARRGGPVMYGSGGKLPQSILRSRLESHMSPNEAQNYLNSYGRGGVVDAYQLMGMPTPRMYGLGGPYIPPIDESLEGNNQGNYNTGLTNTFPKINSNSSSNEPPINFVKRKPTNTINYKIDYRNNLNPAELNKGLNLNADYIHNFGTGWNVNAGGNYNVNRTMSEPSGSPITNQSWNANVGGGYTDKNTTFKANVGYDSNLGVTGTAGGTFNFGGRRANGGHVASMYNVGGFTNPDEPTNPNDMSIFSMTHGNPNRYFETKQEGDKYFVQQKGEFPLSNQQFKTWTTPSATFSSPNQLNEWRSIGANEYNRLNSQAVNGRIGYQTYAQGGPITNYIPSYNFGHVQSKNNTHVHGYGYGGPIGKYDFGSTIKDIGAGAYGVGEGFLDTITMGATDQLTDAGYKGLQKLGGSSESEITQQDSIHGYGQAAGAITGAVVNPGSLGTAISEGSQGLGQGISQGSPDSKSAQQWGKGIEMVGGVAGMATGMGAFGTPGGGAAGMAKTNSFKTSDLGKFAGKAGKVGQGFNAMSSGDPMQMMSMFGGMGNMGGTGTSNFSPDPNKYMNQGIDFNSTAPSFRAMGGAVNAPNMMKYEDGGMAPQGMNPTTQINVEKGELLVDKGGKILTEYRGSGMVPHPEDGSMDDRGTVPAQEGQFVITKRLAPNYKSAMTNNDKLYADAMRNNITFDKQRKEAKQAQQEQMMQQQEMMMQQQMMPEDIMSAQFGGMVSQYGYGGGVMKYDGGGTTFPRGIYPNRIPFAQEQRDVNWGYQPNAYNAINFTGIQPAPPTPAPPPYMRHYGMYPNTTPYQQESEESWNNYNPTKVPGVPDLGYGKMEGQYPNQYPYRVESGEKWGGQTTDVSRHTPTLGAEQNGYDYNKLLDMVPFAATAGLGLEALLTKPFQMNAEDYKIKSKLDAYEEEYRPDYRPYNAAMYAMRKAPGSGSLAGITNLYNAGQRNFADEKYKVNQANAARKMSADQYNISLEGQNLSTAMNIAQFNEQNKANRRNAIREQFGKNLPAVAYNQRANRMSEQALSAAYPNYEFPWNKRNV